MLSVFAARHHNGADSLELSVQYYQQDEWEPKKVVHTTGHTHMAAKILFKIYEGLTAQRYDL